MTNNEVWAKLRALKQRSDANIARIRAAHAQVREADADVNEVHSVLATHTEVLIEAFTRIEALENKDAARAMTRPQNPIKPR